MDQRERSQEKNIFCYREDTEEIRKGDWEANTIPENLRERHVELTGPGNDSKMGSKSRKDAKIENFKETKWSR